MAILSHRNVITQQPSPIFKIISPADNHLLQYDATSEALLIHLTSKLQQQPI